MTSTLEAINELTSKAPFSDCRVYERQTCGLTTTCAPAAAREMKEARWSATIADISQGGLRLVLKRRFEKGTGLAIELPATKTRESSVVFVKVVHVKAQEGGVWALGCKFVSDLGEDELHGLLTAPAATHTLANVACRIEIEPGVFKRCRIGQLDVSRVWPLAPGAVLNLGGKGGTRATWALRIKVTQWTPCEGGWQLDGHVV